MNILVTGAKGFVGRNLVENLKCIRDGKNRLRPHIYIDRIYEYDIGGTQAQLESFCADCDFVFNLTGVNHPKDPAEFKAGNFGFASTLLSGLKKQGNTCPVLLSSMLHTAQEAPEYGLSQRDAEDLFFRYTEETGAPVYVYRFPNLVGKWAQPNDNNAIAALCDQIAKDLPITVNDPAAELEVLFIEDLLEELYDALEGRPHRADFPAAGFDGLTPRPSENGRFCYAPVTHKATLGHIVDLLHQFHDQPRTLIMPAIPEGSFEKKLYSMYLSYLPKEKAVFDLKMNADDRGSFTELLKSSDHGQFSVNISKPGITKGQHWHNTKWEFFIVVSGHGLIQERRIGTDEVIEFEVSGEHIQAVHMLPGYTHNIINLSETENLVTVMWANEVFDPAKPDTFFEKV